MALGLRGLSKQGANHLCSTQLQRYRLPRLAAGGGVGGGLCLHSPQPGLTWGQEGLLSWPEPPPEMATVWTERFTKRQEGLMGWTQRIGLQYLFYQSAQLILLLDHQTLLSSSFLALFILNWMPMASSDCLITASLVTFKSIHHFSGKVMY